MPLAWLCMCSAPSHQASLQGRLEALQGRPHPRLPGAGDTNEEKQGVGECLPDSSPALGRGSQTLLKTLHPCVAVCSCTCHPY